mgnify:CR=1 FL=1
MNLAETSVMMVLMDPAVVCRQSWPLASSLQGSVDTLKAPMSVNLLCHCGAARHCGAAVEVNLLCTGSIFCQE